METNPAIESEKSAIAMGLQQQCTNQLIAELAATRVRVRELEGLLSAKKE